MRAVRDAVRSRFSDRSWHFAVQTNGTRPPHLVPLASELWFPSVSVNDHTLESMDWALWTSSASACRSSPA